MLTRWLKKDRPSHSAVAVVTGAGSGIGRSFALELARRGGTVLCADIHEANAQETARRVDAAGGRGVAYVCDVGDAAAVQQMALDAPELLGAPVTLIINNAGVGLGGKFNETTAADWDWCMRINLWGVIHGCRAFVPGFQARRRGAVINVASAASYTAAPEMSAYNVTKAGVRALSETLYAELKRDGIRVHVLCPTLVPTNIIKNGRLPGRYAQLADHALMNFALTTSDQVARLTLDRCDRGALYTTPQWDAKLFWLLKRLSPTGYADFLGLSYRFLPQR